MKTFIGHPTANQFFRHLCTAFHHSGDQGTPATAFDGRPLVDSFGALMPRGLRREMERRSFREPWARRLHTRPTLELGRLATQRLGWKRFWRPERAPFSVDAVFHDFDRWAATQLAAYDAVYAYEDGALFSFLRARELGLLRAYDLPIAYWETLRRLIQEERDRLPEWAGTLGGGLSDSPAKLERKTRELELAEMVVTPSGFVSDSLPTWARNKVVVQSPFGSPPPLAEEIAFAAEQARRARAAAGQPLRVLFAGSMGQRKGLGDLMAAVRSLGRRNVELVVMGSLQAELGFYAAQCPGFRHEAGRPHAQVLELMRSCDVFCLPSIVEGRALVMQEAMSQGLPLIITPNTGGADLVEDAERRPGAGARAGGESIDRATVDGAAGAEEGEGALAYGRSSTGFLVPIRAPEAIAEAIAWCADHRDEAVELGRAARAKAAGYTWEAYGSRILEAVKLLRTRR